MKLVVLYKPRSEFGRPAEEYVTEFKKLHPDKEVVLMDTDSVEGTKTAELYDIVRYPAFLIVSDGDSSLLYSWIGETLPLMDEVFGYLNN